MTVSSLADDNAEPGEAGHATVTAPIPTAASPLKIGTIMDEEDGGFGFEYDDTRGQKNTMRLDALTYEAAIREARSFLGIRPDDHDADGSLWTVE
jgi:hypothetical protein